MWGRWQMPEEAEKPKTPLQLAEDRVSNYLNGGKCIISEHPAMTQLEQLIMLRQLRIEMPHQSTAPVDIEIAIRKELRRSATGK